MTLPGEVRPERIVLFDGVCNLCNGAVQFILLRDPNARFSFAPLQSGFARTLCATYGLSLSAADADSMGSLVLVESGKLWTKSTAALRIAAQLRSPWRMAALLIIVPKPIRDRVYDWIAAHRYAWFGRRTACLLPTSEWKTRFLDISE